MTDDQERELVAAFLMRGEEYSYEDTVAVRIRMDGRLSIVDLVDGGPLQAIKRTSRWETNRYRLTDAALEKFKGE